MGYPKNFNPDSYGDLLPMLEKALMLPPGGTLKFRIKTDVLSPRTAGHKCRGYFNLNPIVAPREYSVRVGFDTPGMDDDTIQIIKRKGSDFGVEEVEEYETD